MWADTFLGQIYLYKLEKNEINKHLNKMIRESVLLPFPKHSTFHPPILLLRPSTFSGFCILEADRLEIKAMNSKQGALD